jgi:uncharacterized protein with GYD domain
MPTFVMLTRLSPDALSSSNSFEELEQRVKSHIRSDCPEAEWIQSYAVLGPNDYLDLFRAPDIDSAMRVAAIVRAFGHAYTEVWPVLEWRRFKEMVQARA